MLCTIAGSIETVPEGAASPVCGQTGTRSMPIGDFPGSSRMYVGSIGAFQ
jgi:hypothetical protein